MLECAIIGGGPAGLNAALILGRSRREVALFDDASPRNAVTGQIHGFLTRDGITPQQFRHIAEGELSQYEHIHIIPSRIIEVKRMPDGFLLRNQAGYLFAAKKLLLATGLKEQLPYVPGIHQFYGTSLFSCPYCDGWEQRDQPLVIISEGSSALPLTMSVYQWSKNVTLCTNGTSVLRKEEKQMLARLGVDMREEPIQMLQGSNGFIQHVILAGGNHIEVTGGFVSPYWIPSSPIAEQLGCLNNEKNGIWTDEYGRTSIAGVYAAGDASSISPAQAVIAAAGGVKAAMGINMDLQNEQIKSILTNPYV